MEPSNDRFGRVSGCPDTQHSPRKSSNRTATINESYNVKHVLADDKIANISLDVYTFIQSLLKIYTKNCFTNPQLTTLFSH